MMTPKTGQSGLIGLKHTDCVPVRNPCTKCGKPHGKIILFDMYTKDGVWLGSKRTLKYCLEFNRQCKVS